MKVAEWSEEMLAEIEKWALKALGGGHLQVSAEEVLILILAIRRLAARNAELMAAEELAEAVSDKDRAWVGKRSRRELVANYRAAKEGK